MGVRKNILSFVVTAAIALIAGPPSALAFVVKSAPATKPTPTTETSATSVQPVAPKTSAPSVVSVAPAVAVKRASKATAKNKAAQVKPETDDRSWAQTAQAELVKAASEKPKEKVKSKSRSPSQMASPVAQQNSDRADRASDVAVAADVAVADSPATVRAEARELGSAIVRTSLKLSLSLEPHKPSGRGVLASGETMDFSNAQDTGLLDTSLRWLPGEVMLGNQSFNYGGFVGAGYSRQSLPVVAPSGFRYDDVALNTLRFEGGGAVGAMVGGSWNFEGRVGLGQMNLIQTSKYPEVTGSFSRPYSVLAVDASYYLTTRFALMGSVAKRFALADGTGSIALDAISASGGLIVQLR